MVVTIAVSTTTGRSKIWCDSIGITGDGRNAICGADLPKASPLGATLDAVTDPWRGCAAPTDLAWPGLAEISLTGDRLAQVIYAARPECAGASISNILWSSPSGGTVLSAVSYTDYPPDKLRSAIVLYRHGTVTAVSWPGAVRVLLANETAF